MGARTLMDHVKIRPHQSREVYSYQHPYGGIAKDAWVSRDGFARFFDIPVDYVDQLPTNVKAFDRFWDNFEVCAYVMDICGQKYYRITIIEPKNVQR